jgi:hypothetical protein
MLKVGSVIQYHVDPATDLTYVKATNGSVAVYHNGYRLGLLPSPSF